MKYIIANHKNYLMREEILDYITKLRPVEYNKLIICPNDIYIPYFNSNFYEIGVQNISYREPFTGSLSARQLASSQIKYCIVGHSDNRIFQHETNEIISKKICSLLDYNITPILCIGENLEQKENSQVYSTISVQLSECLNKISTESVEKIIFAYEPVWAINTSDKSSDSIPTTIEINDIVIYIKNMIKEKYGVNAVVIYGGNVNLSNIDELNEIKDLDGFLIGSSSTKVNEFNNIISKVL